MTKKNKIKKFILYMLSTTIIIVSFFDGNAYKIMKNYMLSDLSSSDICYASSDELLYEEDYPEENVYKVTDLESLNDVFDKIYSMVLPRDILITLENDIDFSNCSDELCTSFEKIPNGVVFDGKGHCFYGMKSNDHDGIFWYNKGTIKNLILKDCEFKKHLSFRHLGGLVGKTNSGIISNCHLINVTLDSSGGVGGIAYANSGEIKNCTFSGIIKGNSAYIGAIEGASNNGKVENCANFGTIEGKTGVGGISGLGNDVKNCFNVGELIYNESVDDSRCWNGGIIGRPGGIAEYKDCICQFVYSKSDKNVGDDNVEGTCVVENSFEKLSDSYFKTQEFLDKLNNYVKNNPGCLEWEIKGDSYPMIIQDRCIVTGHFYKEIEGTYVEPTCVDNGKMIDRKCTKCDYVKKGKTIDAKGHVEETISAIAPTCTTAGRKEGKKCLVCNEYTIFPEEIPALGHKWNIGYISKKPTDKEPGIKTHTCTRCNITMDEKWPISNSQSYPSSQPNSPKKQKVTKPSTPTLSTAKNVKKNKLTVNWKKTKDAKGYEVQYALNSKFTKSSKKVTTKKFSITAKNLKQKKTYYIRVRAYTTNSKGKKVYGAWSKVKKVKITK